MPRPGRAPELPKDVVLSVRELSIDYATRRGPVHAVRDVSFDVKRGETLAIIGESGSGKTTMAVALIHLSPGSARVKHGSVLYNGPREVLDITTLAADELRQYRWSECAMVFQAALNSYNPVLTMWEHFLDTARAHGLSDRKDVRRRADEHLRLVNLDADRVLRAYPHELSGGMKQRVLIALALLLEPQIAVPNVSGALGSVASIPGSPPDLIDLPPGCTYSPRCPFAIDECRAAEPALLAVDTPAHDARCIRWQAVAATIGTAERPVVEKLATA